MLDALFPYQATDLRQVAAAAHAARAAGVERLWLTHSLGLDAQLTIAALAGRVPELAFGTAVSLMPTRHPVQAAVDARTLAAMTGGRFSLGLGVSEPATVERTLGLPWVPPRSFAAEYLAVVRALVRDGEARQQGRYVTVDAALPDLPAAVAPPPVLLGALGPRMAELAGAAADGCLSWLATPERLEQVVVPRVRAGAEAAGRATPEIVAIVPAVVTDDPAEATRLAATAFGTHLTRPHYRRALADEGLVPRGPGVSDTIRDALLAWGDARAVGARLRRYLDAGASRVAVAAYVTGPDPRAAFARTFEAAASMLRPATVPA